VLPIDGGEHREVTATASPQQTRDRTLLPSAALLVAAMLWGGSYLATRELTAALTVAAVLCARFVPAAAVLLAAAVARRRVGGLLAVVRPGVALGLLRGTVIALEVVGVTLTSPTNAGILIGVSVLITPAIESAIDRRRPPARLIVGVLVAIVGIVVMQSGGGATALGIGDAIVLAAAAVRAVLVLVGSRLGAGADVVSLTTVEITVGAVVFGIVGGGAFVAAAPSLASTDWLVIGYLAFGCTIVSFLLQLWGTARTTASHATLLIGTEPVWAMLIGIAVGGDALSPTGLLGGALVIAATFVARPSPTA